MTDTATSCGCGCGSMSEVTSASVACGCGCECCGSEEKTVEQQIADLKTLRESIDRRLAQLT